jgi:hypothetical protein
MDFWRIVVSIIFPLLGGFWQVGLTIPCQKPKTLRAEISGSAKPRRAGRAVRAGDSWLGCL